MFPHIEHLNDLLPFIQQNPQFRVQEQPNGTTVVCYMLQDEDTFSGENPEYAKECRGITFDREGKILSRTLHKFENVGQSARSQPDVIPWNRIVRVMDKRDGSMITPVLVDGGVVCKTKKTFTSAEALAANTFLYADPKKLAWVTRMLQAGFTPTFEWTSPRFPIVLTYAKDELTLLQIRENVTGRYITELGEGGRYTSDCPFPIVENIIDQFMWKMGGPDEDGEDSGLPYTEEFDAKRILELALTKEGVEGWIVQADDGEMWKIKTKWYCDLHHAVTFTRWRDVARAVLEDKADDLKAAFAMTGRSIQPIIDVERKIHAELRILEEAVDLHVGNGRVLNRTPKDMALAFQNHELFKFVMMAFRGKPVNYQAWYLVNKIRDWSLEVIPTVTQNEDTEVKIEEEA